MTEPAARTLEEWLSAAYASPEAGCPPPEAYLEAETAPLAAEAKRALDRHADGCPACAAERDLARLWDGAPQEAGVQSEDLEQVVARLEEASPVRKPAMATVTPFPVPRRPAPAPSRDFSRLAAAAVLLLVAGLGWRSFYQPEPPLPPPESGGAVRGAAIEALAPRGELEEIPAELRWDPWVGAHSYQVRMVAVDGTLLWQGSVAGPPALLPRAVVARLHRAVTYTWTVEALGKDGGVLAVSEPVRFRATPGGQGPL